MGARESRKEFLPHLEDLDDRSYVGTLHKIPLTKYV